MLKKLIALLCTLSIINCSVAFAENENDLTLSSKSAVLIEKTTGEVLYQLNADTPLPPASVTKVMTLLLIYEAIDNGKIKWEDKVRISEHAASMGGSQIFLEVGEEQSVHDLTKSIAIASANDAAVAMAEAIGGSEESFVKLMNEKAKALGMKNTHFENACGLDSDNHITSARDIAIMSRELLSNHKGITDFTKTWQDTITHKTAKGESMFGLTNTNKLIKQYQGATGLKTGSTSKALYCLSGSAEKDGMELIAVVMGAPDAKTRFKEVSALLDYGFANYELKNGKDKNTIAGEVMVYKGKSNTVKAITEKKVTILVRKGSGSEIEAVPQLLESINAPFEEGTKLGEMIYYLDKKEVGRCNLIAQNGVEKATLTTNLGKLFIKWFG